MKSKTTLLTITILLAAFQGNTAQLILNGGFEQPIHDADKIGVTSMPGWFVSENVDIYHTTDWRSFEGNQALDLSGCTQAGSYISQVFPTVRGQPYRLSFWYANNINVPRSTGVVRLK